MKSYRVVFIMARRLVSRVNPRVPSGPRPRSPLMERLNEMERQGIRKEASSSPDDSFFQQLDRKWVYQVNYALRNMIQSICIIRHYVHLPSPKMPL